MGIPTICQSRVIFSEGDISISYETIPLNGFDFGWRLKGLSSWSKASDSNMSKNVGVIIPKGMWKVLVELSHK